jgi:hypothetical protein
MLKGLARNQHINGVTGDLCPRIGIPGHHVDARAGRHVEACIFPGRLAKKWVIRAVYIHAADIENHEILAFLSSQVLGAEILHFIV